jgi:ABC-type transport system involved in multi-copper enzyme maturation permease subunit
MGVKVKFRQLTALTLLGFRESLRDRSSYMLLISGLAMLFLAVIVGNMAVGGGQRIIQNMGFWVLGLWGLFSIMYFGSRNLNVDLEKRTIYLILSRPVSRPVYILGKYLGLSCVLFCLFAVLAAAWTGLLFLWHVPVSFEHVLAAVFIFGEWLLLAAVSLFFCTFTTPYTHNFFLAGVYVLGHLSSDLLRFARITELDWLGLVLKAVYYVFPNLEALNFRKAALYQDAVDPEMLLMAVFVLIGWIAAALLGANAVFAGKKIK